jgi:hypothetical protein
VKQYDEPEFNRTPIGEALGEYCTRPLYRDAATVSKPLPGLSYRLIPEDGVRSLRFSVRSDGTPVRRHAKLNSVAFVRERTIPTERPPLIGEVSVNFCGQRVSRGQRNGFSRSLNTVF